MFFKKKVIEKKEPEYPPECRGYWWLKPHPDNPKVGNRQLATVASSKETKCLHISEALCEGGFCNEHCKALCASQCPRRPVKIISNVLKEMK